LTDSKFIEQLEKYIDPENINFINVKNKKVVLAIKNFGKGLAVNHKIFKTLNRKGVIIVAGINEIKNLK
jgi:hypothetical protein